MIWLLAVAVIGSFPEAGAVESIRRGLDLSRPGAEMVAVLLATCDISAVARAQERELRLVENAVVVDVGFCATHEHNTGIQRVVRETLPKWEADSRAFELVAWTDGAPAYRPLSGPEFDRVMRWNERSASGGSEATPVVGGPEMIVVPWRSRLVLPEVPFLHQCSPLAALAAYSGNRVIAVGYDAIPLVSAESQPAAESERFARYLEIIKRSETVVAISDSAAQEFAGFVDMLPAQGLTGPRICAVPLAVELPPAAKRVGRSRAPKPLLLCVGSHEPRKNQHAVLGAVELLLREGIDFRMVFVGGGSREATARFDRRVRELHRKGFSIESKRRVDDAELWSLYSSAWFTVFVSLHEGFGLPVAESIDMGVPVVTSDFGSLAEIAAEGGCVTVDPRDDLAIADAIRRLLTEPELLERLEAEAAAVPSRPWHVYADELWEAARLDRAVR